MIGAESVLDGVRAGRRRAVARAITLVESLGPEGRRVTAELHPRAGRAVRVGVTGPPGVGKSTLIGALTGHLRRQGRTVAIVSVDPSSPFTHGAVLGDRIRLTEHFLDPGVFIRSMASRGHLGGLAEATSDAVLVLDAAGFDVILVETVGSGQNEIEVQALAETVLLVLMPGAGDAIQAIKAGLMEIPDVVVVNKADRPGADLTRSEISAALTLVPAGDREVPVVSAQAVDGAGVAEVWAEVEAHRAYLAEGGRMEARRRDGLRRRIRALALDRLARRVDAAADDAFLDGLAGDVLSGAVDPATAVDRLLARVGGARPD
ncbi:MAG: methylmalonyl Co-A mutase-associated GTPase MeaB [Actinomycetota bacterium]